MKQIFSFGLPGEENVLGCQLAKPGISVGPVLPCGTQEVAQLRGGEYLSCMLNILGSPQPMVSHYSHCVVV